MEIIEIKKEEFLSLLAEHSCYYHDAVLCYASDGTLLGFTKYDADGNLLSYWKLS